MRLSFRFGLNGDHSRGCAESLAGAGERQGEQGFMLLGLIVAIFFILLVMSIAAPKVAEDLKREREVEAVHRGNQYVRAIQLYYNKSHTYPGTLEQLEKTNNARYLRQRYLDPMTGKADWRLIHVGEAKTTVKGFFGKPLTGLAPGLGSAASMASPGGTGTGGGGSSSTSAFGSPGGGSYGSSSPGTSAFGSSSPGSGGVGGGATGGGTAGAGGNTGTDSSGSSSFGSPGSTGSSGSFGSSGASGSSGSSSGIASQSATSFTGGGAPFVGVGVPKDGDSIKVLNEQTTYQTWEFLYDPRVEQLKARSSLFGGGPPSTGTSGLGSASSMNSGTGSTGSGGTGSGYGSAPGTGFGTTPTSGTGASGTGSASPTTPPPQF